MIIGIDKGHTSSGSDYGAVGILKESEETRKVGNLVASRLERLGHTVIDCTVDSARSVTESINSRVQKANAQNLDLFISIHFNASDGRGNGVEAYTYEGKQLKQAVDIVSNIAKLGYRNRGVKNGTTPRRLGVVNSTKAPSLLIECMFIDNIEDVNKYNANDMAKAIVVGIVGSKVEKATNTIKVKIKGNVEEVEGFMRDGTNYVPIRTLERLGHKVNWDNKNKIVIVD